MGSPHDWIRSGEVDDGGGYEGGGPVSLLTKLFGEPEEINGRNRCPTYLYRWFLLRTRWFKVYLHHFVGDDWSLDLHDHPKRFISIGLKGRYVEITPDPKYGPGNGQPRTKTFTSPWFRTFPADHIHRLRMVRKWNGEPEECWTLVIVLRGTREWGFWHLGRFVHWRTYVGSETADQMKACGE
jgi:hypothetical protein